MLGCLLGFLCACAVSKRKLFVIFHLALHLPEEWAEPLSFLPLYQRFPAAEGQRACARSVDVQVSFLCFSPSLHLFHTL